ncbi:MAG: hypothetical protein P8X81_06380 [Woeseiaceae bacterium]
MDARKIALGTAAYTVGTFVLAVIWHIALFEDRYRAFGYIEDEPNFLLGFTTILIQGFVLSVLFPMFRVAGSGIARGLRFALLIGVFFWTSHVLAFVAKQSVHHVGLFIAMETVYLALQFGLFGLLIGLIHSSAKE